MARTKTKPPSRSLMELYGRPTTPRGNQNGRSTQQGPYPTPLTPSLAYEQQWDKTRVAKPTNANKAQGLVQYGRWSKSGISWFSNRRSIPGDRPPPPGAVYTFRPAPSVPHPQTPTPQPHQPPTISTPDSEPIVARPRRRVTFQLPETHTDQTSDPESTAQQADSGNSSEESEPLIVRWQRRRASASSDQLDSSTSPSTVTSPETAPESHGSPARKASVASDLYDRVKERARRFETRNVQTRSRSPEVSGRTSRQYRRRSQVRPSVPRDKTLQRATGGRFSDKQDSTAKAVRMTVEEWEDEEEVLELGSSSESGGSEYEEARYDDVE